MGNKYLQLYICSLDSILFAGEMISLLWYTEAELLQFSEMVVIDS